MKTYRALNLKKLMKETDLDFAHYTYIGHQCSCCYGPEDFPNKYWKDGKPKTDDYTYIIFKNAINGSGPVTASDFITDHTYIIHDLKDQKQMDAIIKELQSQLGDQYLVVKPKNENTCIEIRLKSEMNKKN